MTLRAASDNQSPKAFDRLLEAANVGLKRASRRHRPQDTPGVRSGAGTDRPLCPKNDFSNKVHKSSARTSGPGEQGE